MTSSNYFRYPHVHGGLVTFVAEDDVWVAELAGGRAWRVSAMQLPARNPRFSPDGSRLVWTVVQGTAPEVVTALVDGGDYRQLTFFGHAGTKVKGFTAAGDAVVTSAHERAESRHTWAYAVPLDGSPARELPYGPVDSVAFAPEVGDERPVVVGSVLSREPAWWKRYRGGTAGKLWIDTDGGGEFRRLLPELDGNLCDPMWIGGRVAFLSDHEGYGNLYSVKPDGSELRRHTDHEDFYVRHASTDGTRVAFESAGSLWLLDGLDDEPRRLEINLASASTARRAKPLNVGKHLGSVAPDRTGRASAVESHGTVHWLTHRDGPSRILEAAPGVRARLPRPLGEDRVIYVADHGGVEAIYIKSAAAPVTPASVRSLDAEQPPAEPQVDPDLPRPVSATGVNRDPAGAPLGDDAGIPLDGQDPAAATAREGGADSQGADTQGGDGTADTIRIDYDGVDRASEIVASPDGRLAAVATEYGDVLVVNVETRSVRRISRTTHGAVVELAFAPDSTWLAWAEPVTGEASRSKLRLADVRAEEPEIIDLTDGRFHDHAPSFTPDGRFIAFLSERSFDPVYDTLRFDLSFPSSTKPFLLALASDTPSPFGPSVAGAPSEPEDLSAGDAGDGPDALFDGPKPLVVEPVNIGERLIPVPVPQGTYEKLSAVRGALLWLAGEPEGVTGDGRASSADRPKARRLERFDIAKRSVSTLVPAVTSYRPAGDGKRIAVVHEGKVRVVPTAGKVEEDSNDNLCVDLGRIRVLLDPLAVWAQAFDETWRLQRDFYWTEDMAGQDWQDVYNRYRPLVDRLGSHDDLVDLLWEVHGELGTSHAYVTPFAVSEPGAGKQGRLGADFRHTASGWEIVKVLPGESSDPQARSPLNAPGAGVLPGDVLLAIDGVDIPAAGPQSLLVGAADKTVELTVRNGEGRGEDAGRVRRIAVVPVKDEERLRYQDWVAANRRTVREASGETFGYLHVPDMLARGWAQLHRDLDVETAKDALVIDVRRNRGGHTSQLVAELIGRKVTAWSVVRGEEPTTYPAHAPRGPVVVLTDEFAGSDGDIIAQVAKLRGIGPVVGTRTWGGVIGIDGRFKLADGTAVTQPRYATWFTGGVGWAVENHGVDPDIEVPFPPHAYAAGEDPQLEYGVGILKEMLKELPTDRPPARADYPSRRPGPLPKRTAG